MLDKIDKKRLEALKNTILDNQEAIERLSLYLNLTPRFITPELMRDTCGDAGFDTEFAYRALLSLAIGLDSEENQRDKRFFKTYIQPSVKRLDPADYAKNKYYTDIKIPEKSSGEWSLTQRSYAPYEAFVYREAECFSDMRELIQIGYFEDEFRFPAVVQNGVEWMTVTPNEIETMREPLEAAHGRVVTFGLGLGYFAYMASEKENVSEVVVIEKDSSVISLFEEFVLPQFAHKEKIRIVRSDAFDYAKEIMPQEKFDFAFIDIWHDVSDGLELYIRMRKLEELSPTTEFSYWIERSLLSRLRALVCEAVLFEEQESPLFSKINSFEELIDTLSDKKLRKTCLSLKKI